MDVLFGSARTMYVTIFALAWDFGLSRIHSFSEDICGQAHCSSLSDFYASFVNKKMLLCRNNDSTCH